MDPKMLAIFRKRTGAAEAVPALNPVVAPSEPEKKRRRLTKASEKESAAQGQPKQTALTIRPPKPPTVPEVQGKGKEKEREMEKTSGQGRVEGRVTSGLPPQGATGPNVTRGPTGVHPGPVAGVSIASLVSGKRPFQEEKDAFELYSPLVPASDFDHFSRLSGQALMRKVCHADAQAHTIALASAKKALALETSLKNSQAALTQKCKEAEASEAKAAGLAAELKEAQLKIEALEAEASQSRALKEKNAALAQVVEDLKHQVSVRSEGLRKALEAAKALESRTAKVEEALKTEGERAVAAFMVSQQYEAALEDAVEKFKASVAGEQFVLQGIERWREDEDGQFWKAQNFNTGFEEFRKAAKNRFPDLDLSQVCLEDLFPAPTQTATAADTALEGDVEGGEEVSKPDEVPLKMIEVATAPTTGSDQAHETPPPALAEAPSSAAEKPQPEQGAPPPA